MKKRLLLPILGLIFTSLFNSLNTFDNVTKAVAENAPEITFGYTGDPNNLAYNKIQTVFIYGNNVEELASLQFEISYPEKVHVQNVKFNWDVTHVDSCIYDYNIDDNSINVSMITNDSFGSWIEVISFDFYVLDDFKESTFAFDFKLIEACNFDLMDLNFTTQENLTYHLNQNEKNEIYNFDSSLSEVTIEYGDDFEVAYTLPNWYGIIGGTIKIIYDSNSLELLDFNFNEYFNNFIYDINTDSKGIILFSFAGPDLNWDAGDMKFSASFRSIVNSSITSNIQTSLNEFVDYNMIEYQPKINKVIVKNIYTEAVDLPKIYLTSDFGDSHLVDISVCFDKNTHLGAGDFIITFDQNALKYISFEKMHNFSYFIVNTNHINEGIIKFSIINLEDVTEELIAIKFTFEAVYGFTSNSTFVSMEGNNLYDSTSQNKIRVNVLGVEIPLVSKNIKSFISHSLDEDILSLNISFDENSSIKSGKFSLKYDAKIFEYNEISTTLGDVFVNLDKVDVTNNVLYFSFVSNSEILTDEPIISINFKRNLICQDKTVEFLLSCQYCVDSESTFIHLDDNNLNLFIEGSGKHSWTKYYYSGSNIHYSDCDFCNSRMSGFCKNVVIDEGDATCQKEGTRTLECSLCHNTSTENYYGDHELVSAEINEGDTMITYHCKHCDYTEEHALSLMYLSSRSNFNFSYVAFDNEITIYLTKGDTFQILLNYSYKDVFIFGASGIDPLGGNLFECYLEGAYRFYYSEDSDTFVVENADSSNELMLDRANTYKEKLRKETEDVWICDEGGVIDEKFDTLLQIVEEYQNMSSEMKNIIDSMHCFGDYTCYDVLTIVTRGLMKAGWTNNSLSNHYYVQLVNDNESILMFAVISFVAITSLVALIINKKKRV